LPTTFWECGQGKRVGVISVDEPTNNDPSGVTSGRVRTGKTNRKTESCVRSANLFKEGKYNNRKKTTTPDERKKREKKKMDETGVGEKKKSLTREFKIFVRKTSGRRMTRGGGKIINRGD